MSNNANGDRLLGVNLNLKHVNAADVAKGYMLKDIELISIGLLNDTMCNNTQLRTDFYAAT